MFGELKVDFSKKKKNTSLYIVQNVQIKYDFKEGKIMKPRRLKLID